MRKCPSCNQSIEWLDFIKISRVSPIECKNCEVRITLDHPSQMVLGFLCLLPGLLLMVIQSRVLEGELNIFPIIALLFVGVIVYFKKVKLKCQ